MYRYIFSLLLGLSLLFVPSIVQAQTPTCTIIYGGGEIECEATVSATAKVTPTPTTTQSATESGQTASTDQGQTTKGGLPVYETTNATETPATGPEAFALIGLIPAALGGIWLRKKGN